MKGMATSAVHNGSWTDRPRLERKGIRRKGFKPSSSGGSQQVNKVKSRRVQFELELRAF